MPPSLWVEHRRGILVFVGGKLPIADGRANDLDGQTAVLMSGDERYFDKRAGGLGA